MKLRGLARSYEARHPVKIVRCRTCNDTGTIRYKNRPDEPSIHPYTIRVCHVCHGDSRPKAHAKELVESILNDVNNVFGAVKMTEDIAQQMRDYIEQLLDELVRNGTAPRINKEHLSVTDYHGKTERLAIPCPSCQLVGAPAIMCRACRGRGTL